MLSIRRLMNSFKYAGEGFRFAFKNDQNFLIHFVAATFVIILGVLFQVNRFEFIVLSLLILLVLVAEMINTSIEKMVDLITTDHHPSAKFAKDVASAMVLLTAIGASIIGFIIFAPYFAEFLF